MYYYYSMYNYYISPSILYNIIVIIIATDVLCIYNVYVNKYILRYFVCSNQILIWPQKIIVQDFNYMRVHTSTCITLQIHSYIFFSLLFSLTSIFLRFCMSFSLKIFSLLYFIYFSFFIFLVSAKRMVESLQFQMSASRLFKQ